MAAINLELLIGNNEKSWWGGCYFEFNEPKLSSSEEHKNTPEQNTNEPECASSTKQSEVAKTSSNFLVFDLKDYDMVKETIEYFQINHVIKKPSTKSTETEENLKQAEFMFMIDQKILIHKTSVDPKLLQLKNVSETNKKIELPWNSLRFLAKSPKDLVCHSLVTGLSFQKI